MKYDPYNQQESSSGDRRGDSPRDSRYDRYDEEYVDYQAPKFAKSNVKLRYLEGFFVPTGTYKTQYRRPWVTDYNPNTADLLSETVARAYHGHIQAIENGDMRPDSQYAVRPSDLYDVSGSFIQPSASYESEARANLRHGWNEQTCRFMLTIEVDKDPAVAPTTYVLVGYTNEMGVSQSGRIDPNMELNINTMFEVVRVRNRGYDDTYELRSTQQILVDEDYRSPDTPNTYRMRPSEIAANISLAEDDELSQDAVVVDTRTQQNGAPEFSDGHNTNPNDYMARILTGMVNGRDMAVQSNSTGRLSEYSHAANLMREASPRRNPFFKAIASKLSYSSASFRWRDLLDLAPEANDDRLTLVNWRDLNDFSMARGENMYVSEESYKWSGEDLETRIAVMISNALPSIMMDLGLRKIDIYAANTYERICTGTHPIGVVRKADMHAQARAIGHIFESQVVRPMTENFAIPYDIDVQADLAGDIVVTLRLEREERIYCLPAFCSAAMTPVVSTRRETLNELSKAFNHLKDDAMPEMRRSAGRIYTGKGDIDKINTSDMPSGKRY